MAVHDDYPQVPISSRAQLRAWLEANHASCPGAWLVRVRKAVDPDAYVSQGEVARECLCFGWIDSQIRRLDEDHNALKITPRRAGSMWSRVNKEFVEELEAVGLMTAAGRAAIAAARADGSWSLLDEVEALVVPEDLAAALEAEPALARAWEAWPDSIKKQVLWQLVSAKRPPTRARRLAHALEKARAGERPY